VRLDRVAAIALTAVMAQVALSACADDDAAPPAANPTGGEGAGIPNPTPTPISAKAAVKFKTKKRLVNDVKQALSLDDEQVCTELGSFDCAFVHSIALGGVDAYDSGVFEPLKTSAVTTPIAVDRLVLSACQTRAHLDFKSPANAVLFKLDVADDKLVDPAADSVTDVIHELFKRTHLRLAKDRELAHVRQLYLDIEPRSATPAKDWSALSCYSVMTMMESVFY
jgi:hypothetical protein